MADEGKENQADPQVHPALETKVRFPYPIVLNSDIPDESKRREMVDLCQIACEKHAAAEKNRFERNNQAAATMIKETLDKKMDGPFNVVVGEAFTFDIDYVEQTLLYMIFGGYLSVCVWKCV